MLRLLRDDFERHGPIRGVMHSFTGERPTAEACLGMGLYLSFAGIGIGLAPELFPLAKTLQDVIRALIVPTYEIGHGV